MRGAATTRCWSSRSLIVGAVLAVSVLGPAARAAPGDTIWTSTYGVPEQVERGRDSVLAPDGSRLFVTGVDAEGSAADFLTVAYDATTGSQLWVSTYDAGRRDEANHVAVAPDGSRVYVVGFSREAAGADYVTIAYDAATGEELWSARHSGTGHRPDLPSCVAASGTHVFVTGSSRGRLSWDFVTLAYDAANGQFRWLARFDRRDSEDYAQGCALAPDDSAFFVTGRNHIGDRDAASAVTIAYSSATGEIIWSDRFDDRGLKWDEGIAMTTSSDGLHVYVVGLSNRSTPDYLTVAYEAISGSVEWHRVNEAPGFGAALDVAVTPDGATVFATGYSAPLVRTVAYSTVDGQERWRRTYRAQDFGTGESLAVSPDGSIVYAVGWEAFQSFAVAYDAASGATLWERHEPASAWGSVSTSSNGDLYLAGIIAVGEDRNVLVAAYEGAA